MCDQAHVTAILPIVQENLVQRGVISPYLCGCLAYEQIYVVWAWHERCCTISAVPSKGQNAWDRQAPVTAFPSFVFHDPTLLTMILARTLPVLMHPQQSTQLLCWQQAFQQARNDLLEPGILQEGVCLYPSVFIDIVEGEGEVEAQKQRREYMEHLRTLVQSLFGVIVEHPSSATLILVGKPIVGPDAATWNYPPLCAPSQTRESVNPTKAPVAATHRIWRSWALQQTFENDVEQGKLQLPVWYLYACFFSGRWLNPFPFFLNSQRCRAPQVPPITESKELPEKHPTVESFLQRRELTLAEVYAFEAHFHPNRWEVYLNVRRTLLQKLETFDSTAPPSLCTMRMWLQPQDRVLAPKLYHYFVDLQWGRIWCRKPVDPESNGYGLTHPIRPFLLTSAPSPQSTFQGVHGTTASDVKCTRSTIYDEHTGSWTVYLCKGEEEDKEENVASRKRTRKGTNFSSQFMNSKTWQCLDPAMPLHEITADPEDQLIKDSCGLGSTDGQPRTVQIDQYTHEECLKLINAVRTCGPHWEEVSRRVGTGSDPSQRPHTAESCRHLFASLDIARVLAREASCRPPPRLQSNPSTATQLESSSCPPRHAGTLPIRSNGNFLFSNTPNPLLSLLSFLALRFHPSLSKAAAVGALAYLNECESFKIPFSHVSSEVVFHQAMNAAMRRAHHLETQVLVQAQVVVHALLQSKLDEVEAKLGLYEYFADLLMESVEVYENQLCDMKRDLVDEGILTSDCEHALEAI